ncbi:MAG: DUF3237 domain-containing protein [Oleispira sp.]
MTTNNQTIRTEALFDMHVTLKEPLNIGASHVGHRIIFDVESGFFTGEKLKGNLKASGGDWLLMHPDGTYTLDVRVCLETDDGALIYMSYKGRWVIPDHLKQKVLSNETCAEVDPDEYYQRNLILFEVADKRYQWLNNIVAVSQGYRTPVGISYRVMAVL